MSHPRKRKKQESIPANPLRTAAKLW